MSGKHTKQAKELEQFYAQYGGTSQGKFRLDRRETRSPQTVSREKIPRNLLPEPSHRFLIVRTQEMVHPKDPVFAMQFLGTVATQREADEITEEIYHAGYDRFPIRVVDLNAWRVFPPPMNAAEGDVKYHQLLLRQVMERDMDELNRQEEEMDIRLRRIREDEKKRNETKKAFHEENMKRAADGLELLDASVLQERLGEPFVIPVPEDPNVPAKALDE